MQIVIRNDNRLKTGKTNLNIADLIEKNMYGNPMGILGIIDIKDPVSQNLAKYVDPPILSHLSNIY